jgi:hypothetical protein
MAARNTNDRENLKVAARHRAIIEVAIAIRAREFFKDMK